MHDQFAGGKPKQRPRKETKKKPPSDARDDSNWSAPEDLEHQDDPAFHLR